MNSFLKFIYINKWIIYSLEGLVCNWNWHHFVRRFVHRQWSGDYCECNSRNQGYWKLFMVIRKYSYDNLHCTAWSDINFGKKTFIIVYSIDTEVWCSAFIVITVVNCIFEAISNTKAVLTWVLVCGLSGRFILKISYRWSGIVIRSLINGPTGYREWLMRCGHPTGICISFTNINFVLLVY